MRAVGRMPWSWVRTRGRAGKRVALLRCGEAMWIYQPGYLGDGLSTVRYSRSGYL